MEVQLAETVECPVLPEDFRFEDWSAELLKHHADVKYQSFRHEVDANVFPCLGDADGCYRLMREISLREGFLAEATWLIQQRDVDNQWRSVATIQGVRDRQGNGSIQNVGVIPEVRGLGVGAALLLRSLHGFQSAGIALVSLEVTSQNVRAIQLYERLGFRIAATVYKAVEMGSIQPSAQI